MNLHHIIGFSDQLKIEGDFLMSYTLVGLEDDENATTSVQTSQTLLASMRLSTDIQLLQPMPLKPANWPKPLLVTLNRKHSWVVNSVRQQTFTPSLHELITLLSVVCLYWTQIKMKIVDEFYWQPTVEHYRRIGRFANDKTQNLLVTLEWVDHVRIILLNAKQLRNSDTSSWMITYSSMLI